MEQPFLTTAILAASGKVRSSDLVLTKARTVSVTCRATYNSSATSGVQVNVYYSPDGSNFDTVVYTSYIVDLTAGSTIQETKILDVPEHGYLKFEVENLDATYTATNIKLWYSIQSWQDAGEYARGHEIVRDVKQLR